MSTLVSVVTLTYKKYGRLNGAIDSVLSQDYPDIEYIISDDGSPDFPRDKIEAYINRHKRDNLKNLIILEHEKNQGTVKNVNDAYRHARGEIIIPVSSDDELMDPHVISKIVSVYKERGCETLATGRALYNKNGDFIRNIPSSKAGKILSGLRTNKQQYQRFITNRFFEAYSGCTLSMKKSFIEERGYFDEKYTLWEDGPFFAQYLWDHYMECAFDIISMRYNDGGVSSGSKHPLLLKDAEIYRKTDMVAHLDELTFLQRAIVRYSLKRSEDESKKGRLKAALMHPFGFIGIKVYRLRDRLLRD